MGPGALIRDRIKAVAGSKRTASQAGSEEISFDADDVTEAKRSEGSPETTVAHVDQGTYQSLERQNRGGHCSCPHKIQRSAGKRHLLRNPDR
jgi:hypothetical protein